MAEFPELPDRQPFFVGRRRELEEIRELFYRRYPPQVLKIIGPPGIGKTALVRESLETEPRRLRPLWFSFNDISEDLESFGDLPSSTLHPPSSILVGCGCHSSPLSLLPHVKKSENPSPRAFAVFASLR